MTSSPRRRLILLRHAKSAWPDVADHERPLARRGRHDAPAAGRWLRQSGCVPDSVLCSTASRARETWQLAQEKLGARPPAVFERRIYGASSAELLDLARQTPPDIQSLLIVGHDPAMRELTLELAAPGDGSLAALGRVRIKFPTGAVAVLCFTGSWPELRPGRARLTEFAVPRTPLNKPMLRR